MSNKKKNMKNEFFTNEKKQELVEKLYERFDKTNASIKCPMCEGEHFFIADAYLLNTLQLDIKKVSVGGPSIPSIAIVCKNCGFISQHALGVLDLLPEEGCKNDK